MDLKRQNRFELGAGEPGSVGPQGDYALMQVWAIMLAAARQTSEDGRSLRCTLPAVLPKDNFLAVNQPLPMSAVNNIGRTCCSPSNKVAAFTSASGLS